MGTEGEERESLAPLDFEIRCFANNVLVEKHFSPSFDVVKSNFTTVGLSGINHFGNLLEKSTIALTWKNTFDAHARENFVNDSKRKTIWG